MGGLLLVDFVVSQTVLQLTVFIAPANAGASIWLRSFEEDVPPTVPPPMIQGEVFSITHRNADGSDTPIQVSPASLASTSSTGIAFDPAMSSVTWQAFAFSSSAEWVCQIFLF